MPEVRRLEPHDPIPESGRYILAIRRFGEDDPQVAIAEIVVVDGENRPELTVAVRPDGSPMLLDEAIRIAAERAEHLGCPIVYAVDRTAGPREREVLRQRGDHTVGMEKLADEDAGEQGTDVRDRPMDAGYNLTPHRQ